MADTEKKKLNDLRVVDLKSELEKRSLEVTGVKTILIERLIQVRKIKVFLLSINWACDVDWNKASKAWTLSRNNIKSHADPVDAQSDWIRF